MAASERRALGRGLGSLIPDREPIVSRETIDDQKKPGRPSDLFFEGGSREDSKERRSASIAADLLKPSSRTKKSGARKKSSAAKPSSTAQSGKAKSSKSTKAKTTKQTAPTKGESKVAAEETKARGKSELAAQEAEGSDAKKDKVEKPLFEDIISGGETLEEESNLVPVPGTRFGELEVHLIIANTRQPREVFDEDELEELADSIKQIGVLQPIVVRPIDARDEMYAEVVAQREEQGFAELPRYELIMGERRLRASKLAGMNTIPAIIRDTEDTNLLRDALLENLHRTQLNPIEEAAAYQQLMSDFACTQQELSERIARSRSQIANSVRLLKLPPSVQRKLAAGVLSAGHARALLGLKNGAQMEALADRIISEGLSVRSTEEIVALGDVTEHVRSKKHAKRLPEPPSERASVIINRLTDLLDTRVTVQESKKKGRIVVEFAGQEDLERISEVVRNLKGPIL